jgi:hypothetical protein
MNFEKFLLCSWKYLTGMKKFIRELEFSLKEGKIKILEVKTK